MLLLTQAALLGVPESCIAPMGLSSRTAATSATGPPGAHLHCTPWGQLPSSSLSHFFLLFSPLTGTWGGGEGISSEELLLHLLFPSCSLPQMSLVRCHWGGK